MEEQADTIEKLVNAHQSLIAAIHEGHNSHHADGWATCRHKVCRLASVLE